MIRAKVIGWSRGYAELFEDEHGCQWEYIANADNETIAVQRIPHAAAGVFTWANSRDEGTIAYADDEDIYDMGSKDDFIAVEGHWAEIIP